MKTPNMFFKVVVPIIAIGILLAFLSINYLNSFVEENINHEISQKVQFQTNSIDEITYNWGKKFIWANTLIWLLKYYSKN